MSFIPFLRVLDALGVFGVPPQGGSCVVYHAMARPAPPTKVGKCRLKAGLQTRQRITSPRCDFAVCSGLYEGLRKASAPGEITRAFGASIVSLRLFPLSLDRDLADVKT